MPQRGTGSFFDAAEPICLPALHRAHPPRPARPADGAAAGQPVMPVRDPSATVAEIAAAARARLPGTTIHRRLFFRYTLRWDKPR